MKEKSWFCCEKLVKSVLVHRYQNSERGREREKRRENDKYNDKIKYTCSTLRYIVYRRKVNF